MSNVTSHPHVDFNEEVGRYVIKGTKVPAYRLYAWHKRGTTFETLFKRYPQLRPAQILDAVSFAYDNTAVLELEAERVFDAEPSQRRLPF